MAENTTTGAVREELSVHIDGRQGTLVIGAHDIGGEDGVTLWIGRDEDEAIPVGVDPDVLLAAVAFVLGRENGDQDHE